MSRRHWLLWKKSGVSIAALLMGIPVPGMASSCGSNSFGNTNGLVNGQNCTVSPAGGSGDLQQTVNINNLSATAVDGVQAWTGVSVPMVTIQAGGGLVSNRASAAGIYSVVIGSGGGGSISTINNAGTVASIGNAYGSTMAFNQNVPLEIDNSGQIITKNATQTASIFLGTDTGALPSGDLTVKNTGTIYNQIGTAIGYQAAGTLAVNNSGTIKTDGSSAAIAIGFNKTGTQSPGNLIVTNTSTGTITGGIATETTGLVTIINAGTISPMGDGDGAISNDASAGGNTITNTGVITGDIHLAPGGDTVNLNGGSVTGNIIPTAPGTSTVNVAPGGGKTITLGGYLGDNPANPKNDGDALSAVNINSGKLVMGTWGINAVTTTVAPGATLALAAMDPTITGNLAVNGTLDLGSGLLALQAGTNSTGSLTTNSGSTILTTVTGPCTTSGVGSTNLGRITASGAVTLANGTTVTPTLASGVSAVNGARYILATGSSATVGNVTGTTSSSLGVGWSVLRGDDPSLGQSANAVYLVERLPTGAAGSAYTNSGSVAQPEVTRAATAQVIRMVAAPVDSFLMSGAMGGLSKNRHVADLGNMVRSQTGVASGETAASVGMWVNGGWSHLSTSESASKSAGNLFTATAGADVAATDKVLAGAGVTMENTGMTTDFNQGHLNNKGVTLSPYLAWRITDKLGLSVMAGHSWLDNSEKRTVGGNVSGSYQGSRWMASSNLSWFDSYGDWTVNAHGGYRWALESDRGFTETDNSAVGDRRTHLGEASIGGRVSRAFDEFEPYGGVTLLHDFSLTQGQTRFGGATGSNGRNGVEGIIGISYAVSDSTQLSLEGGDTAYANGSQNGSVMLNVRWLL